MKKGIIVFLVIVVLVVSVSCLLGAKSPDVETDVIISTPDGGYVTGKATNIKIETYGVAVVTMDNGVNITTHISNMVIITGEKAYE